MLTPKLPQQEQGFALTEVLISLLIISLFIAVTMQATLIAAIFKAKAEQHDEAITWIQEDLEFVKHQASEYKKNDYPDIARCNATTANDGLAAGLLSTIGHTSNPKTIGSRILGGKDFILTRTAVYDTPSYSFKLLQLTYKVMPLSDNDAIAMLSTEVIPDAALKCP
ncbi:MAG TPA: prepilin-type cleavage/methylation domain-containing protein [Cyanobacteria bacterium UBA11049]|nr:prepilin-type cleavage/methylation domain-containing protein [Cyanobacteria bacterium UBA11049]